MKRICTEQERNQVSESLLLGALLAVVGGFLDAYTYLCRGGVFANAQTGNIVMLGICLSHREWFSAAKYLIPIFAFSAGVVVTELVRHRYREISQHRRRLHWRQLVVLAEIILAAGMAFVPQSGNVAVNIVISFICAMQAESFRKLHGSAFATTMCTGNLRSGTEQLVLWMQAKDAGAAEKSRSYYEIILFFIAGAVLGSFITGRFAEKALLAAAVLLVMVFFIMFIKEYQLPVITEKNHL